MKQLFAYIFNFSILLIMSCGSGGEATDPNSLFALLPSESGADGLCTVSGLGSQVKAGFTSASTTEQPVLFRELRETSYSVVQVSNANVGTVLEISAKLDPDVYPASSCPLDLDRMEVSESGTDFLMAQETSKTKITFLKQGSYLVYSQVQNRNLEQIITALLSGTPPTASGGSTGTVGDLTFNKSCNNTGTKICTNLYGTEKTCQSGETEGSSICSKDNAFGICRISSTGAYKFIVFYNGGSWNSLTAPAACSTQSGSFSTGYSDP